MTYNEGKEHGHTEIVQMLLNRGADCNKCYKGHQSPVMKSCKHGHTDIVKMLLDRELDCLRCDHSGLSIAYGKGYNDIIELQVDLQLHQKLPSPKTLK